MVLLKCLPVICVFLIFGCRNINDRVLPCKEIIPGVTFEAKVHDTWCLPDESVKITIGPIVEDSRCNVKDVECFWAGRTVLALQIETKEAPLYHDTLFAVDNWQDDLSIGSYTLSLKLILPTERLDFNTDTTAYSFRMILEQ